MLHWRRAAGHALVQQQQVWFGPCHFGERDAALLPAAERVHGLQRQRARHAEAAQVAAQLLLGNAGEGSHEHAQRAGCHVQPIHVVLREDGDAALVGAGDVAAGGFQRAADEAQQRALADAVGAHDGQPAARVQAEADAPEDVPAGAGGVRKVNLVERDERARRLRRLREAEHALRVLLQALHVRHARERLDAALHQRRALGVKPEAGR